MNGGFHFALPDSGTKRGNVEPSVSACRNTSPMNIARHGGSYGDELLGYSYEVRPDENGSRGYDAPDFIKKEIRGELLQNNFLYRNNRIVQT